MSLFVPWSGSQWASPPVQLPMDSRVTGPFLKIKESFRTDGPRLSFKIIEIVKVLALK